MKNDVINGSVTKTILMMSWPTMIAMLLQVGFNVFLKKTTLEQ